VQPGGQVGVVERHHGDVVRHAPAGQRQRLVDAESDAVVHRDERPRPAAVAQERRHRLPRRLGPPEAVDDARHPRLAHRPPDALEPFHRGDLVRQHLADDVHVRRVPGLQERGRGRAAGLLLVGHDHRVPAGAGDAVEQDDRVAAEDRRHRRAPGRHRAVEEPADAAVEHVLRQPLLDLAVALGLADEHEVLVEGGGREAAPHDLAGERLGRDDVGDEPDRLRVVGTQAPRHEVRPVVELARGAPHTLLGVRGDAHVASSGHDERGGGPGHPGPARDVAQGDPRCRHASPPS
jgi:hypothetical protein